MHYRAPDDSIHFLEDSRFEYLLPAGSVSITVEQADELRAQSMPQEPSPPTREERIAALDATIKAVAAELQELKGGKA